MPQPEGVSVDIHGLLGLSSSIKAVGDEVGEVVDDLEEAPAPTVDVYGWQATAEAMTTVLDSWSTEVDLVRRACRQVGDSVSVAAEMLAMTDGANATSISTYW